MSKFKARRQGPARYERHPRVNRQKSKVKARVAAQTFQLKLFKSHETTAQVFQHARVPAGSGRQGPPRRGLTGTRRKHQISNNSFERSRCNARGKAGRPSKGISFQKGGFLWAQYRTLRVPLPALPLRSSSDDEFRAESVRKFVDMESNGTIKNQLQHDSSEEEGYTSISYSKNNIRLSLSASSSTTPSQLEFHTSMPPTKPA